MHNLVFEDEAQRGWTEGRQVTGSPAGKMGGKQRQEDALALDEPIAAGAGPELEALRLNTSFSATSALVTYF